MAHFTELDQNNIVLRVIVVSNDMLLDENENESEAVGIAFCQLLFGANTIWKQTSYNASFRKNYAGIGYTYDVERDAFIAPMPDGDGLILDENTCQWRNPALEKLASATTIEVTRV